jgi:hypothetical protein
MFTKQINRDDSAHCPAWAGTTKRINMLLSTAAFTLEVNSLASFSIKFKGFDSHMQRPPGQPFWFFSREACLGGGQLYGFGFHAVYDRPLLLAQSRM